PPRKSAAVNARSENHQPFPRGTTERARVKEAGGRMLSATHELPRLLLADDHAMLRDGLRAILNDEGFEVVAEASDGREAVKLGQSPGADVAILDISMPLLNGIDAAREILKSSPKTKIIILT